MSKSRETTAKRGSPKRRPSQDEMDVEESKSPSSRRLLQLENSSQNDDDDNFKVPAMFLEKFQEKSPTSKLTSAFGRASLEYSNRLREAKTSSRGGRSIGRTAEERGERRQEFARRDGMPSFARSRQGMSSFGRSQRATLSSGAKSSMSSKSPKKPRRRSRSQSQSPHKSKRGRSR